MYLHKDSSIKYSIQSNGTFFHLFCQVLALNRGEQNKVLTLKLTVPKQVENQFLAYLRETLVPTDASGKIGCPVQTNNEVQLNTVEIHG